MQSIATALTLLSITPVSKGLVPGVITTNRLNIQYLCRYAVAGLAVRQGASFTNKLPRAVCPAHTSPASSAIAAAAVPLTGPLQYTTAWTSMGKATKTTACAVQSQLPDVEPGVQPQQENSRKRLTRKTGQQLSATAELSSRTLSKRHKAAKTTTYDTDTMNAAQQLAAAKEEPTSAVVKGNRRRRRQTVVLSTSAMAAAAAASMPESVSAVAATTAAANGVPLLDIGPIIKGELVKRPSASVKTPYVSDVRLPDGSIVLAHTPSLDCAGMIKPGSTVHMTLNAAKAAGQQTPKTTHAVQLAEDIREDGQATLVGAHPYLAEKLADAAVQQHLLPLPQPLQGYTQVLKQQTVGLGRFDFVLCYPDGSQLLLEVKNAVCADFPAGRVPEMRGKNGVYISSEEPYVRTALFPIGSRQKSVGVVSDRAIKHLHELIQLQQAGQDSTGRVVKCAVLFIVNRGDCSAFKPCDEADNMFAQMLHKAQQSGVLVMAHDVSWQGGQAVWGKQLPVVFAAGIDGADVDDEQLQAVLTFNATNPRTRWKKAKKEQGTT